MKLSNAYAAFGVLALFGFGGTASQAQNYTFFPDDATINTEVMDSAVVGYATVDDYYNETNGTSPVVSLVGGGSVDTNLYIMNSSTVNVAGGSVGSALNTNNNSTANISSGSIGYVWAFDGSTVNVTGGSISDYLRVAGPATANISGGSFGIFLEARNGGTINFFGTGLSDTLVDPDSLGFSVYSLTGTLADGSDISSTPLYIQNGSGASFTLNNRSADVPEPGSLALLVGMATAGASLLRKRCKLR